MVLGSSPTSGLVLLPKAKFFLRLKFLGHHTPEPTQQCLRSDFPKVSLLAVDWAVDVVGEDIIVISVRLRPTIL